MTAPGIDPHRDPLAAPRELKKYELLCRLATGGMAELWLARSKGMGGFEKTLVIKRILPAHAKQADFVKMFLDEARIAATLQHTNVVQVFDVDSVDGNVFMAMEFLHGQDLRAVLEKLQRRGGRLPLEHALTIVLSLCAGLHYAHEKVGPDGKPLQIVHRDVSPANVLVTYDGNVKLIDFGIARASGKLSDTQFGIIKGKLGYMSPEQCLCEPLDRQSDVFCIGIILWELVAGRPLYPNDDQAEAFRATCDRDAPLPSTFHRGIPPELDRIASRALQRKRSERYATAVDLQRDLERFVRDHRLPISPFGLAGWMEERFGRELAAWKTAQRQGRSLADFIATYRTGPTGEVAITGDYASPPPVPAEEDDPTTKSPVAPTAEPWTPEAWPEGAGTDGSGEYEFKRRWRGWPFLVAGFLLSGLVTGMIAITSAPRGSLPIPIVTPAPAPAPPPPAPAPEPAPPSPVAEEPVVPAVPDVPVAAPDDESRSRSTSKKKTVRKKKVAGEDDDDLESVLPR